MDHKESTDETRFYRRDLGFVDGDGVRSRVGLERVGGGRGVVVVTRISVILVSSSGLERVGVEEVHILPIVIETGRIKFILSLS